MAKPTRAEELAKKAAKVKAKEAFEAQTRQTLLDFDGEEEQEDTLGLGFDTASTEAAFELNQVEKQVAFDIFKDIGEPRFKIGDIVEYTVRKNNAHIATLNHPFSWEDLHRQFGDGTYQVQARGGKTKQFIKSETRTIGNPTSLFNSFAKAQEEPVKENPQPQAAQTPSFMEIMTLLLNQQNIAKNEARELSSNAATSNNQMMMMFMEMMKSNQAQATQMQIQTMQMMTQVTEKLSESQQKMFDKINERIEKLAESKKGFDVETFVEKMQKAQAQGFELYQKFDELATKKAELQLEMMGSDDDEDDGKKGKEPLIDSVIRAALPMIAGAQGAAQMPQSFIEQPRRQLPPNQNGRGAGRRQGTGQVAPTTNGQPNKGANGAQNKTNVPPGRKVHGKNIVKKENGFPAVDVTQIRTEDLQPEHLPAKTSNKEVAHEITEPSQEKTVKEKCNELLPSFLGTLMLESTMPDEAARKTIEFLNGNGILTADFLREVSLDDLIQVARSYSLPEEAYSWLNEVYADIQTITRAAAWRESAPSDEPELAEGSAS